MSQMQETSALPNKVTVEAIEARIVKTVYWQLPGTTATICQLSIDNGFEVRGESACVDPANFDEALGEKYSREDAFRKLWPLFGFLLTEDRFRAKVS
jgi:hypothetical protein